MRNRKKLFCMTFLFFALCLVFRPVSAQAATLEKVTSGRTSATFSRDLTGDGTAEKITVTAKGKYYDYYKKIAVSVNGKNAATLKASESFLDFEVQYLSMSKSKQFLIITARTDNGYERLHGIYRYNKKTKKLVEVLDLFFKYCPGNAYITVTKATSGSITAQYSYQYVETARICWNFVYTYKNGKFQLKSKQATVKSEVGITAPYYGDGYSKYFRKNQFKAAKSLTFYTSTSLSKKAFTAKKGDVVTLQKIRFSGKYAYLRFKKGSKTGWVRVGNSYASVYKNGYKNGWFYGTGTRLAG